uniref:HigA family addiction module antitoxin n=2 Tax=Curtanaerobium respiraculi TaxID=2949669 RepID=UPI0024B3A064|nr:HigA family addiction module antitoxin [Curtanaerobium respiraculi]
MATTNDAPIRCKPATPGEIPREEFMEPMGIGASFLAQAIGFSRQSIYQVLNGSRAISADMAIALGECPMSLT